MDATAGIPHVQLVEVVAEFTRTVTGDFSVQDLLRGLVRSAVSILDADGAGIVLAGADGRLRLRFASPDDVVEVEKWQDLLQDGPCFHAHRTGQAVTSFDLEVEGEWPAFQTRAVEAGVHTVAAFPLPGADGPIGVLDVYRRTPRPFTGDQLTSGAALADLAASYLAVTRARDEAREAKQALAHRAMHDLLTGLPVRWVFLDSLQQALQTLSPGSRLAVLFVDLDGLKYANDHYGHSVGDELIKASAKRLTRAVRSGDTVARVGGDEFLVLLPQVQGLEEVKSVAARVVQEFAAPPEAGDPPVQPSASIGIVLTDASEALTPDALVSRADAAMYLAKQQGRSRYALFDPYLYADATSRAELLPALQQALDRHQLVVHYQPIVDIRSRAVVAVEALVRWRHPERGLLNAEAFIPAAEHAHIVAELGGWVLETACEQLAAWDRELGAAGPQRMFVNVSVLELSEGQLEENLPQFLARAGLTPDRIVLEITESGFLDEQQGTAQLSRLRRRGFVLAIDDFGAGYSSLGRLVHLPVSVLKVDRTFAQALSSTAEAVAVISSVLRLGADLGCDVVVEGVEDAATLHLLGTIGCRYAQGYHLARPLPADALAAAITT